MDALDVFRVGAKVGGVVGFVVEELFFVAGKTRPREGGG